MANFDLVFESVVAAQAPAASSAPAWIGASLKTNIPNGVGPGRISKQLVTPWVSLDDTDSDNIDLDASGFAVVHAIVIETRGAGSRLDFGPAAANGWSPLGAGEIDGDDYLVRTWRAGRAVTGSAKDIEFEAAGAIQLRIHIFGA